MMKGCGFNHKLGGRTMLCGVVLEAESQVEGKSVIQVKNVGGYSLPES
jgi:hypothetical protein